MLLFYFLENIIFSENNKPLIEYLFLNRYRFWHSWPCAHAITTKMADAARKEKLAAAKKKV